MLALGVLHMLEFVSLSRRVLLRTANSIVFGMLQWYSTLSVRFTVLLCSYFVHRMRRIYHHCFREECRDNSRRDYPLRHVGVFTLF